jgi:hypothetical protein
MRARLFAPENRRRRRFPSECQEVLLDREQQARVVGYVRGERVPSGLVGQSPSSTEFRADRAHASHRLAAFFRPVIRAGHS